MITVVALVGLSMLFWSSWIAAFVGIVLTVAIMTKSNNVANEIENAVDGQELWNIVKKHKVVIAAGIYQIVAAMIGTWLFPLKPI